MSEYFGLTDHEKFNELCALAHAGTLTATELSELKIHLQACEECRDIYGQYRVLTSEGMPLIATRYFEQHEREGWNGEATRRKLFACVRLARQQSSSRSARKILAASDSTLLWQIPVNSLRRTVFAAVLVIATAVAAYHFGYRNRTGIDGTQSHIEDHFHASPFEKEKSAGELFSIEATNLSQLQKEASSREKELLKLRFMMRAIEDRANGLAVAKNATDEQVETISRQRDALSSRVQEVEQAYRNIQAEAAILRSEHEKASLQIDSLESRIEELSVANRDQERRLAEDKDYLASDRDIREMMGARKLYIADVFDVDSRSRTQSAFGRVFYTSGKSLLFYAFDLDGQPNLKKASTFQAWGRREDGGGEPLNLGIFYLDNETNRRWVLRFDDPKHLAEIDEVFVTVEPRGGSRKPTGKPFLYALLREVANHP